MILCIEYGTTVILWKIQHKTHAALKMTYLQAYKKFLFLKCLIRSAPVSRNTSRFNFVSHKGLKLPLKMWPCMTMKPRELLVWYTCYIVSVKKLGCGTLCTLSYTSIYHTRVTVETLLINRTVDLNIQELKYHLANL